MQSTVLPLRRLLCVAGVTLLLPLAATLALADATGNLLTASLAGALLSAGLLGWLWHCWVLNPFRLMQTAVRRLQEQTLVDPLTGLNNRRWLQTEGERLWRVAERSGAPLSLLAVDLDYFKDVNDTYGHPTGDHVLRNCGQAMQGALRATDAIVRLGGDEFLVVLPETPTEGAMVVAGRLLESLAAQHIEAGGDRVQPPDASVGASCSAQGEFRTLTELTQAADEALYAAKSAGGGRVERWQAGLNRTAAADDGEWTSPAAHRAEWYLPGPMHREFHRTLSRLLIAPEPEAAVRELLRSSVRVSGASCGAVFLWIPEEQELRYTFSVGVPAELDEMLRARPGWPYGEETGITGWVAKTRTPLYVPDVLSDPRWTGRSPERRSAFWVPLVVDDQLFGVFNVVSDVVDGLPADARGFIVTMSRYTSLVLERHQAALFRNRPATGPLAERP